MIENKNRSFNRYFLLNWIKERTTKDKKKKEEKKKLNYSILINGDYGIGKSTFINNCLNYSPFLNIHYLSQTNYTEKGIIEEFKALGNKNKIFMEQDVNNQLFDNKINILLIDENYYYELIKSGKMIKKIVEYNQKNFTMLIIIITNDNETLLYQNLKFNCDYLKLSVLSLEDKKKIYDIKTDKYNDILNSTDNLNILNKKIKMIKNGLNDYLVRYNKRCDYVCDIGDGNKKKSKINLNIFYDKSKLKNKNNIIQQLNKCVFNQSALPLIIQENYISPILLKYDNENSKDIKPKLDKINKSLILSDKFEKLINLNQYWELNKYYVLSSCLIPLYYLNKINVDKYLNLSEIVYPKIYNKLIYQKKKYNSTISLNLSLNSNYSDYYKLLFDFIMFNYSEYKNIKLTKEEFKKILNFYNIDKKNIVLLSSFNNSYTKQNMKNLFDLIAKLFNGPEVKRIK